MEENQSQETRDTYHQPENSLQQPEQSNQEHGDQRKKYLRENSKRLMDEYLQKLGIGKLFWEVNMELMRPKQQVMEYCENLAANIESGVGMLLSGGLGVGKTTILSFIAKRAFLLGTITTNDLVSSCWYTPKYDLQFRKVNQLFHAIVTKESLEDVKNCDLLLLDDFGSEYRAEFPAAQLEEIMDFRYANRKATIVTTNIAKEDFKTLTGYERTIDRFRDSRVYRFVEISGKSMRGRI
jgi:DNA replication protein DnaC